VGRFQGSHSPKREKRKKRGDEGELGKGKKGGETKLLPGGGIYKRGRNPKGDLQENTTGGL